jgi:hypothetical protein
MIYKDYIFYAIIILLLTYSFFYKKEEKFSKEAVENVASIYNEDKMTINNLTTTNKLKSENKTETNDLDVQNKANIKNLDVSGKLTKNSNPIVNMEMFFKGAHGRGDNDKDNIDRTPFKRYNYTRKMNSTVNSSPTGIKFDEEGLYWVSITLSAHQHNTHRSRFYFLVNGKSWNPGRKNFLKRIFGDDTDVTDYKEIMHLAGFAGSNTSTAANKINFTFLANFKKNDVFRIKHHEGGRNFGFFVVLWKLN